MQTRIVRILQRFGIHSIQINKGFGKESLHYIIGHIVDYSDVKISEKMGLRGVKDT